MIEVVSLIPAIPLFQTIAMAAAVLEAFSPAVLTIAELALCKELGQMAGKKAHARRASRSKRGMRKKGQLPLASDSILILSYPIFSSGLIVCALGYYFLFLHHHVTAAPSILNQAWFVSQIISHGKGLFEDGRCPE